jgi:hypothetical protein
MKLKPNVTRYKIPPVGEVVHGYLVVNGQSYRVPHVRSNQINSLNPDVCGLPQMFCIKAHGELMIYPKPDGPYDFRIAYFPPMKQL